MGTQLPLLAPLSRKGGTAPNFRPMSVVAKLLDGSRYRLVRRWPWPRWGCVRWGLSCPLKGAQPPVFGPCLLWLNGWMHQDTTWYGGRPRPRWHCKMEPSSWKGAQSPNFRPCLLWPDGWMDQDTTWYKGRPWPRPHRVRRGPSPPWRGHSNPPVFGPSLLWPRSPISTTAELLFYRPNAVPDAQPTVGEVKFC